MERVQRPTSQKSVYHSAALVYEKLMNGEIEVEKAETAVKALAVMNTAYANEIKRSKFENKSIRILEIKTELPQVESGPQN